MKKLLVIGIIVLFLCVSLVPGITSKTSYVDDTTPPETFIEMNGTMNSHGYYISPVKIKITATDDYGMGEIHYILDGRKTVVPGDIVKFTVNSNGEHNLEYWGVDASGNKEIPHHIVIFSIPTGPPNYTEITEPKPGLYFFGYRIMNLSKIICIGPFTIEVNVPEWLVGTYGARVYLDNELIADDNELPYSAYCNIKHFGEGTLKAIAYDLANYTAEATLDIHYYKFQ